MKNYHKFYIILLPLVLILSCGERKSNNLEIQMVNFDYVNSNYVLFLKNELASQFRVDSIYILNQPLPESTFYPPRNRYRADKLIRYLRSHFQSDKIIGLTDKDISTTSRNQKDWGIMGLAYCPGKSCVVSTFRTFRDANSEEHKKDRLKKVVFHEFGHTLGLPHCENEKSCLMRDASGKVSTVDETSDFCLECKSQIKSYLK